MEVLGVAVGREVVSTVGDRKVLAGEAEAQRRSEVEKKNIRAIVFFSLSGYPGKPNVVVLC